MPTNVTTIVRSALLLLAGGFAAQHSRVPLSADDCRWFLCLLLVLLVCRRVRVVVFFLLGFVLFMQAGMRTVDAQLSEKFAGESMLVQARVADFPKRTGQSVVLLLEPVADPRLPARSRVTWFDPPAEPQFGDVWQLELRLRRPRGSSNPGVFSFENWMFREKIHASGYVVPGKRNQLLVSADLGNVASVRSNFVRFATRHAGSSAAVLSAISVGARHLISRQQWSQYATSGTSHLMAISGLHIGLAATTAFVLVVILCGVCRLPGNHLDKGTLGGALLAFAYAFLSGFLVPSQRAFIMLCLIGVAFILRRRPDSLRIVALSSAAIFLVDPLSLMKPGFSLSFAAVLSILWFTRVLHQSPAQAPRPARFVSAVRQLVKLQIVLLLGLLPLTLSTFQKIALLAPPANLVCVPIFSFVTVPSTLLSMLLFERFEAVAAVFVRLAAGSVALMDALLIRIAGLRMFDLSLATADLHFGVLLLPILWVVLPRAWPGRCLALVAATTLLFHQPQSPRKGCFDLHVLDVGQGLAVFIEGRQHTLLFDTGASYRSGGSAAKQVILPFLKYRGVRSIDRLVVSHADNDHSGGVGALADAIPVQQVYYGESPPPQYTDAQQCVAGDAWSSDGVDYRFLHPTSANPREGNDTSCVLMISSGDHRVLLTGDIEVRGENDVLRTANLTPVDVVVIPHHGSLTSSTPAFVNRLRPTLAIASAGFDNRWGFPRDRVRKRWEGAGATLLNTATSGAVSLRVCRSDGIRTIREQRESRRRFWHDSTTH